MPWRMFCGHMWRPRLCQQASRTHVVCQQASRWTHVSLHYRLRDRSGPPAEPPIAVIQPTPQTPKQSRRTQTARHRAPDQLVAQG